MEPTILGPGEGERVTYGTSFGVMKATAETTGGGFSMTETLLRPQTAGPPPHAHRETTDTFYVLEGTLRVLVGDDEVDAASGTYVVIPPGVLHTFSNTSDSDVRFLNINTPGGWERYLRELSAIASGGPPDPAAMRELLSRYDFVLPD
jgi:mannose-6-phosphate isomerase-like protein (cupin superfamily)